jgi:hypothetical protein
VKRFFAMFVLTPGEQRLVIFIVVALVLGASIKHYRDIQVYGGSEPSPEASPALVSPTPNER